MKVVPNRVLWAAQWGAGLALLVVSAACTDSDGNDVRSAPPVGDSSIPNEVAPTVLGPTESPVEDEVRANARLARRMFHTAAQEPLPTGFDALARPWSGDLDGMIERRLIRFLTVYAPETYYLDRGEQSGVTFELARRFEDLVNESHTSAKVYVVLIPVRRDQVIPAIEAGLGDIAAANLTVTASTSERVDFSSPLLRNVRQVVATGPSSPELATLNDLSGKAVHIRQSSSYWEHLQNLSDSFVADGHDPVLLVPLDESLEDHDALQMVAHGLIPLTIVDDHVGRVWAEVLAELHLRSDLSVSQGREVAWAFRKGSPELAALVNRFLETHRQGTLVGNVLMQRFGTQTRARRVLDRPAVARLDGLVAVFQKYGTQYDIPWEVLAAMAYLESGFDPTAESHAGAVGIMQLMPATAAEVGFDDITGVDNNVHAAARYLRRLRNTYVNEPGIEELDRALLVLAAYNAGPNRLEQIRAEAHAEGLDRNVWFDNVELIVARRVGRVTVEYVSHVFKFYVAFHQIDRAGAAAPSRP